VTAHPISVVEVRSRSERDEFIKFPWRIYKNDPAWVPPLIIERRSFLDRNKHPFYQHGDAALFLAKRDDQIVGRIMASDDPNYNALHNSNVGCFGLFESIDDVDVARALFESAADWLRRRGRTEIMGPIDYSTNYVCGLLIDGFEYPPTLLTAHNPPYYARLIEACGFEKEKDWYAWWFAPTTPSLERLRIRFPDHFRFEHAFVDTERLNRRLQACDLLWCWTDAASLPCLTKLGKTIGVSCRLPRPKRNTWRKRCAPSSIHE